MQEEEEQQDTPEQVALREVYLRHYAAEAKYHPFFGASFRGDYSKLRDSELAVGFFALWDHVGRIEEANLAQMVALHKTAGDQDDITPEQSEFLNNCEAVHESTKKRIQAQRHFLRNVRRALQKEEEALQVAIETESDPEGSDRTARTSGTDSSEKTELPGSNDDTVDI